MRKSRCNYLSCVTEDSSGILALVSASEQSSNVELRSILVRQDHQVSSAVLHTIALPAGCINDIAWAPRSQWLDTSTALLAVSMSTLLLRIFSVRIFRGGDSGILRFV